MIEQRSEEWFKERLGCVSGSVIGDVMAKPTKGKPEAIGRKNLKARLACELMTGKSLDGKYQSWDMKRGIELEPQARVEYELATNEEIESVGFVLHPKIPRFGASPDAFIGKDGLLELKCPNQATHLDYVLAGIVPTDYRNQILAELACTGRQWADFVSFHPDMPEHLQLFVIRMKRDEVKIAEIEAEVIKFNAEVDELIAKLPKRAGQTALESQLEGSLYIQEHEIANA
jgi:putative phage-type endonuclease